jgi:hypothetical protein
MNRKAVSVSVCSVFQRRAVRCSAMEQVVVACLPIGTPSLDISM